MKELDLLVFNIRRKAPGTIAVYKWAARKFLAFNHGDYSRTTLLRFLAFMETYSKNLQLTTYYAIKKLYKALEKPFPLDADDLPLKPDRSEMWTPTLTINEVKQLIMGNKIHLDYHTSLLFLSTIYGPRATEMSNVSLNEGTLTIYVAKKKGSIRPPREHLIPVGTSKYLWNYEHAGDNTIFGAFPLICERGGVVKPKRGAWHSIRRALATEMKRNKISVDDIERFMRWERSSSMVNRYDHISVAERDQEIFLAHPFLDYWL